MHIKVRGSAAIGGPALLIALGGCGAGQVAATAEQGRRVGRGVGRAGSVLLRDAQITYAGAFPGDTVYEPGDDAVLQVTIVNEGRDADRLVGVRSPIATGMTYPVVFDFETAGERRVGLPVEYPQRLPPRASKPDPDERALETGPELVEVPD